MIPALPEECDVLLRDGGIAHLRPLRPTDAAALHALVDRASERSTYLRFCTGGTGTAHAYMDRMTGPGYQGLALVALLRGRLAGVAECVGGGPGGRGDLGILLDDQCHGLGLGTVMLEHLAQEAAENGVKEIAADVLPENRTMLRVLADSGLPSTSTHADGMVRVLLSTGPSEELLARIEAREHEADRNSLAAVFAARSVAVIGAGRAPGGAGHRVLANLVEGGFAGAVHPVNPHAAEVCGLPALPAIGAVPGGAELAVIATPAAAVLDVARDCARHGVRGLVVLSAGFAEAGDIAAETELLRICRAAGMRLIGPNCLGIVNTATGLNASFLPRRPRAGGLGLMSQSGAVAAALVERAAAVGLGISSFASVGNKADVSGNDLLEYWEDDPATEVIALYLESFGNPRRFGRIARRVGAVKPIIVVKSGRGAAGGRAVRSHTAAAATPDAAVDALLRAAGVIREDGVRDMLDTARLLALQPLPAGGRVAIIGNSGGPQAMTADACERLGLTVPEPSPPTREALRARLRPAAAIGNPVDVTADGTAGELADAVRAALADPGFDAVLVVYTPPFGSGLAPTCEAVAAAAHGSAKTVLACVAGYDGLIGDRTPSYAFPEQAVHALARAAGYAAWRSRPADPPVEVPPVDGAAARRMVEQDLAAHPGGRWLDHAAAARLVACYGVRVTETVVAGDEEEAAAAATRLGPPVVLKATGPGLVHKSDVGGVEVGLRDAGEVRASYRKMAGRIGPAMTGALVQRVAAHGVEMIVGGVAYEAFGPLVMAGPGGVTAELLADHAFRAPPISHAEAARMLGELRCAPLLHGYRGRPAVDVEELEAHIIGVGRLMDDIPEIAELDLNPVIVTPSGAVAVDVRVRLAPAPPRPSPYRRRLR
ncbi:GNAT family N-acetyltransferase [Sphaerisporangium melleum]|uniref:GNAT family N-acetyltransferase n=1 Tax=Sphaerisporangium melleum TaxID=321316 RepID=A0A917VRU5_9ACTN|nr:bifunctional GNAT family N-acetyltransferase/acetate--CoA ligase family protein [Sphaerisporangium melleum]GGL08107.1 GNAT family N-acetyltransferase [Sphaerisporangium melleum]GII74308.1 GNAT family N-acetyltransferase [Sphaerisporangium melleum]